MKIILHYSPEWRSNALESTISLPKYVIEDGYHLSFLFFYTHILSLLRLQKIDWRIDIKSSSDTLTRMSVPTAIVQLEVGRYQRLFFCSFLSFLLSFSFSLFLSISFFFRSKITLLT